MRNITTIPVVVLTLVGLGVLGTTSVNAQVSQTTLPTFAERIAKRFNLNLTDVQSVFSEVRNERKTMMIQHLEERLSTLVTNGKLTEAQKQLILAKHRELQEQKQKNMESWQTMTLEQRKAAREKERTDLENWAKENNIDLSYVGGFARGFKAGFKHHMHWEN